MKKIILIFFFIQNILSFNILLSKENKIIVKVEDKIVSSYDVKNKINTLLILSGLPISQKNIDDVKNSALKSLIDIKLKMTEVEKYQIKGDEEAVRKQLINIASGNIELFKQKFLDNGLDYKIFIEELETEMAWQKLIFSLYNKKVSVDENALEFELNKTFNDELTTQEYRISEIDAVFENLADKDKKVELIKKNIQENGFEDTAIKYSISSSSIKKGDLGWISTKAFSKEIYDILKNMKIGEVSKPIIKPKNVIFLKLTDKRNKKNNNLSKSELKEKLIIKKKEELYNLYSMSHLSKIRNTSLIEYK